MVKSAGLLPDFATGSELCCRSQKGLYPRFLAGFGGRSPPKNGFLGGCLIVWGGVSIGVSNDVELSTVSIVSIESEDDASVSTELLKSPDGNSVTLVGRLPEKSTISTSAGSPASTLDWGRLGVTELGFGLANMSSCV